MRPLYTLLPPGCLFGLPTPPPFCSFSKTPLPAPLCPSLPLALACRSLGLCLCFHIFVSFYLCFCLCLCLSFPVSPSSLASPWKIISQRLTPSPGGWPVPSRVRVQGSSKERLGSTVVEALPGPSPLPGSCGGWRLAGRRQQPARDLYLYPGFRLVMGRLRASFLFWESPIGSGVRQERRHSWASPPGEERGTEGEAGLPQAPGGREGSPPCTGECPG